MDRDGRRTRVQRRAGPLVLAAALVLAVGPAATATDPAGRGTTPVQPPGSVVVLSTDGGGAPGRADSSQGRVSSSGRWVAFTSAARLGRLDQGRRRDVYLLDRRTGGIRLLSRSPRGVVGDARSEDPDVSGTGRYTVFTSRAGNLVPGGGPVGVYRFDRLTGRTVLVAPGARSASISDDGRSVVLLGAGGAAYVVDVGSGEQRLASHVGDDPTVPVRAATHPRISGNGRFVVYATSSGRATDGDQNSTADVVRWDRRTGSSVLLSATAAGASGNGPSDQPDVSADGARVVFRSRATDLVGGVRQTYGHVYVRDVATGLTRLVDRDVDGGPARNEEGQSSSEPAISPDGGSVSFSSNGWHLVDGAAIDSRWPQTYVRHLAARVTELVSHDRRGDGAETASWGAALSRGGETVTFTTNAPSLVGRDLAGYPTQVLAFASATRR